MGQIASKNINRHALAELLKSQIEGEVHFDLVHKKVYSVDASIYEIEPLGIIIPKHKQDLMQAVRIAYDQGVPIIARGAATGIAGGCIGQGLIIDLSKYFNRILQIDYEQDFAICEPGVVQDRLNEELSLHGYRLGPDTSTGNRATLGGMLANNAAGARSLRFGTMADHILEIELLLSDGEIIRLQPLGESEWSKKCQLLTSEGRIYRMMSSIRDEYRHDIEKHFPKIPRRVSGYNLEFLLSDWPLNPCKIVAGSEGTLGIILEMKVRICQKPRTTGACVLHFDNMLDGMRAVESMLIYHPLSLEMIDRQIIERSRHSPLLHGKLEWLSGNPEAIFVAEFEGETQEEVHLKLAKFTQDMQEKGIGQAHVILPSPKEMAAFWEVRKAGLGLLLSKRSYSRAIAFLEDIAIDPSQLASFMEKFCAYLKKHGKEAGIYGHVGAGCMHIRPYIDLRHVPEIKLMEQMMEDISDLLLEYGGALSGEHGDGLVRSWLNKKMFGDRIYGAFIDLKEAFDPEHLMNPGKIVHGQPLIENLRLDPKTNLTSIRTFLDFQQEGGFELAVDLCNGNGLCRKAEKVMCPSFQATHDEFHTTRARAQALRAIIHKRMPLRELTGQGMFDVMDLCLECKGCKSECPSAVDMAKMKAEFLYHYQREHGTSLRNILFANIGHINHMASIAPTTFNRFSQNQIVKSFLKWMGLTTKRALPKIASKRLSKCYRSPEVYERAVVLYNDTFTEFNHPEVGHAAINVLNAMGYQVILPPWQCCGRPAISKGKLPQARTMAEKVIRLLAPYAKQGLPIIGLEPSCLLTIKDDFASLVSKHLLPILQNIIHCSTTFAEFIHHNSASLFSSNKHDMKVRIHGHCHQKALVGMKPTLDLLKAIPGLEVLEIESGCCGMAGSFGYEREHYDLSMNIGELQLFPSIRSFTDDIWIVADGFSCRSQIEHGTQRRAYHLAELLAKLI